MVTTLTHRIKSRLRVHTICGLLPISPHTPHILKELEFSPFSFITCKCYVSFPILFLVFKQIFLTLAPPLYILHYINSLLSAQVSKQSPEPEYCQNNCFVYLWAYALVIELSVHLISVCDSCLCSPQCLIESLIECRC